MLLNGRILLSWFGSIKIIGDPREHTKIEKNSGCEIVIIEKSVDARENIKMASEKSC